MGKTPKQKGALPSGNIRIQVYDYTDSAGKKHYKSFTAATRKEAKVKAEQWRIEKESEPDNPMTEITVSQAVMRYIELKEPAISPSTVRGYLKDYRNYLNENQWPVKLSEVNSQLVQLWISWMIGKKKLSPKTTRNAYGLLKNTLDMFVPDLKLKVTLPAPKKPELYCPNDSDIKNLLTTIKGTDLEIAVLLAAFGPLRRGEICALTDYDVVGNTIYVRHSIVRGKDGGWVIKQPKTLGSYRAVEFPDFVIHRIDGIKGALVKLMPDQVSNRFKRALKKTGLPHFRFHDLRHYAASIMHAIGVPDQYILQRGGWSSDYVMKTVYRNVIDTEMQKQNQLINSHFEKVSHEISHDNLNDIETHSQI